MLSIISWCVCVKKNTIGMVGCNYPQGGEGGIEELSRTEREKI